MKSIKKGKSVISGTAVAGKKKDSVLKIKSSKKSTKLPNSQSRKSGYQPTAKEAAPKRPYNGEVVSENELLVSTLNNLPGIFYLYDEAGKFIRWNKNFETVTGYSAKEISRMHPLDFYDDIQKPHLKKRIKEVFEKAVPGIEVELLCKQKKKIPFYINSRMIMYDGKKCLMGIGTDITERRLAEETHVFITKQLERTAAISKVGGWEYDFKTKKRFWSVETLRILEINAHKTQALGEAMSYSFYAPAALSLIKNAVKTGIDNGTSYELELPMITAKGRPIWVREQGNFVRENGKTIKVHGVIQDITEHKQAKEALTLHNKALVKINEYSLKLSMLSAGDNLDSIIARGFKEIAETEVSIFSGYDPVNRTLTPKHIEMEPGLLKKVVNMLGKNLDKIHSVVTDELYAEMTRDVIGMRKTLHEISFGAVPQPVGALIQALLKVDRFIAVAHVFEGKLYGTSLLAIKKGKPEPSREILENFSLLVSVSLRRKQAEDGLVQSERKYRLLTDKASDVVWLMDLSGKSIYVSPVIEKFTGYTCDEYLNQTIDERFTPTSAVKAKNLFSDELKKYLAQKKKQKDYLIKLELDYRCKDGNVKTGELLITPYFDDMNLLTGIHGVTRDITVRKKMEEELRSSEARYRLLIESANEAVVVAQGDKIRFTNKKTIQQCGYSEKEILAMPFIELIHPDFRDLIRMNYRKRIMNEPLEPNTQVKIIAKDKSLRWVQLNGVKIDWEGAPAVMNFISDITEIKAQEEALKESELSYRSVIEQAQDAIFISNPQLKYVDVNTSACKMLGYSRKEFLQLSVMDLVFKEDLEKTPVHFEDMNAGKLIHYERRFKRKDGTAIEVEITGKKLADGRNLIFARDITERKKTAQEIARSKVYLQGVLQSAAAGILAVSDGDEVLYANERFSEMWQISPELMTAGNDKKLLEHVLDQLTDPQSFLHQVQELYQSKEDSFDVLYFKDGKIFERLSCPLIIEEKIVGRVWSFRNITERKQVERDLKESKTLLFNAFNNSPLLMTISELSTGKYIEVNDSFCRVSEYSREQVIGKTSVELELISAEDHNRLMQQLDMKGMVNGMEIEKKTRTGKIITCRFFGEIVQSPLGPRLFASTEDITERKKAEIALQQNELKYRHLVEKLPDAIVIYRDGKIIFVNDAVLQMMHAVNHDEIIGKPVMQFVHPDYKQVVIERMEKVYTEETAVPVIEEKFLRLDGSVIDVEVQSAHVRFENRPAVQMIIRDITQRKQIQAALYKSEQQNTAIIKTAIDGFWEIDSKTQTISDINEAYCKMSGYSRKELLGMPISLIIKEQEADTKQHIEDLKRIKQERFESEHRRKDGTIFPVDVSVQYSADNGKLFAFIRDITERKQVLNEISLNEKRWKTLFEKASDGILIMDARGQIVNINESFAKMHGYNVEDMMKMNLRELDTPEMAKMLPQKIAQVMKGEKVHLEVDHLHKDGHIISLTVSSSLVEVGNEKYIQAFHQDITERKKVQEKLKQLSQAVEQSPASIFITNTSGEIEYVNPKFEKLTGYSLKEAFGKNPRILKSGHTSSEVYKQLWEIITRGKVWSGEFQNRKKNGELYWEWASISPIIDDKGTITHFLAIKEDISEKKAIEQQIKKINQKQEAILNAIPDLLFEIGADGRVYNYHTQSLDLLAAPPDGFLNKLFSEFLPSNVVDVIMAAIAEAEKTGLSTGRQYSLPLPQGKLWFEISIAPIHETVNGGRRFIMLARDITERKLSEMMLVDQAAELKQSNDELENFAYLASHDLQEPLRMVNSFLNLLEKRLEGNLDETTKQYIDYAINGAGRMKILIKDLLEYSRVGSNKEKFAATNLNEVLQYSTEVLEEKIKTRHARLTIQPLPVVMVNKTLVTQLFINLLSNAIKYCDHHQPRVEVGYTENKKDYTFFVKDNGIGIDLKYKEKIFVIFQRLHNKKEYSGTGIGLAVCKKIMDIHKGRIWVESELGKGSTFYFTLPK